MHYLLVLHDIKILEVWKIGEVEGKGLLPFLSISTFERERLP